MNPSLDIDVIKAQAMKMTTDSNILLMLGAKYNNIEVVQLAVDTVANVNDDNDYALRQSVDHGNYEMVKLLIEHGADVHADYDYALRTSAKHGHFEIVRILIAAGADLRVNNYYPLRISAKKGHTEIVQFLIEKNSDVNVDNSYPLRISAEKGHIDIVKQLVAKGANTDFNTIITQSKTLIDSHTQIIQYLSTINKTTVHFPIGTECTIDCINAVLNQHYVTAIISMFVEYNGRKYCIGSIEPVARLIITLDTGTKVTYTKIGSIIKQEKTLDVPKNVCIRKGAQVLIEANTIIRAIDDDSDITVEYPTIVTVC